MNLSERQKLKSLLRYDTLKTRKATPHDGTAPIKMRHLLKMMPITYALVLQFEFQFLCDLKKIEALSVPIEIVLQNYRYFYLLNKNEKLFQSKKKRFDAIRETMVFFYSCLWFYINVTYNKPPISHLLLTMHKIRCCI